MIEMTAMMEPGYRSPGSSWYDEDPITYHPQYNRRHTKYAALRDSTFASRRKYGNGPRMFFDRNYQKLSMDDYDESSQYKPHELEELADDLLRQDSKRELCRKCRAKNKQSLPYGHETGNVESKAQYNPDTNEPITDGEGHQLYTDHPEYECDEGHRWFAGEGERRNWDGPNSVLMEEHLQHRRRREIYTESDDAMGVPDPSIVSGLYHRTHPQGRKVNSKEQRKRNGASFYR